MRRIIKFLSIFLFVFILFLHSTSTSFSQPETPIQDPLVQDPTAVPSPNQGSQEETEDRPDFTTEPPLEEISEKNPIDGKIKVTFYDLSAGSDNNYAICTGNKFCFAGLSQGGTGVVAIPMLAFGKDEKISIKEKPDGEGNLSVTICGKKDNKVQTDCNGRRWFWGGNIYTFSIGREKDGLFYPLRLAFFYVGRSYPTVAPMPFQGLTTESEMRLGIANNAFREGGWRRNNYKVEMRGGEGYYKGACTGFEAQNSSPKGVIFNGLSKGTYTIAVKEQVDDDDPGTMAWRALSSRGDIPALEEPKGCDGGFIYWTIKCTVANPKDKTGGRCDDPVQDPRREEYSAYLKDLAALNKIAPGTRLPCGEGKLNKSTSPDCPAIKTAIGEIKVNPQGLVESIFKFVLVLAGFGAIIILIYSGYILMTSAGNKEKIASARETITSAIVGLLFIILSIVILEIIGVDILRIPGLTR